MVFRLMFHIILISLGFSVITMFFGFFAGWSYLEVFLYIFTNILVFFLYLEIVIHDLSIAKQNRELDPKKEWLSFEKYLYREVYTVSDILVMLFYLPIWIVELIAYASYFVIKTAFKQLKKCGNMVVYAKKSKNKM
ncbi:hypothetical protein [Paenibacillus polymyxa]|uniref:Uncharacterized protein n=1 Tax=Paenibacillus polymyxa (strain SC2) TaxID=886882 RepID=E3EK33_PAEPS|nr:hypothetical protein [Paenibacillus polymyxa]ADO59742.1 hypothetical protein PPSC2_26470 [Paenibacillus polymyxa SC2]WPQ60024.1 hypothetical protein SKN87_27665 [Paenibacillus polymyxa]